VLNPGKAALKRTGFLAVTGVAVIDPGVIKRHVAVAMRVNIFIFVLITFASITSNIIIFLV